MDITQKFIDGSSFYVWSSCHKLLFVFLRMSGRKNGKQLSDVFQKLRANYNKKDQGSKKRPDPSSETSKVRKKNEIFERV